MHGTGNRYQLRLSVVGLLNTDNAGHHLPAEGLCSSISLGLSDFKGAGLGMAVLESGNTVRNNQSKQPCCNHR